MIYFDPLYLLLLIFFLNFIPGALLSFSILKEKNLFFVEKLFIGFALGLIISPLIPFILSLVGILYSFNLAILSTILFYLIAIYLAYKNKPWEQYKNSINLNINKNRIISLLLILIIFLSYWIRIQSYSPIYFDLDPYFYLYSATQIITMGIPPLDDQTAWYPEVVVDHRIVPVLSYLESIWYSFYTSGGEYNNYLLALVASFYPPIMAMLAVFFLYLFISSVYKREFGLIAAATASFIPILIYKLSGSEFEIQAYAFFSLSFFYAFYALSLRNKDLVYYLLASFALAAIYLGSGSMILLVSVLIIFIPLQSLFLFLKREKEELFEFVKLNIILSVFGVLLPTILYSLYKVQYMFNDLQYVIFAMAAFSAIIYAIKHKYWDEIIKDKNRAYLYGGASLVIIIAVLAFTPIGSMVTGIGKAGLLIAEFTQPLQRTIQEQAPAGQDFIGWLGYMGTPFSEPLNYIFAVFSFASNTILRILIEVGNALFGTFLQYDDKENSPMLVVFFFLIVALVSSFNRTLKGSYTLPILFLAVIFPPFLIGILKSKYTIYAGFMISAALGVVLGELAVIAPDLINRTEKNEEKAKENKKTAYYLIIVLGAAFVISQFYFNSPSPGILLYSLQPRFQEDPMALQLKFQNLCDYYNTYGSYDPDFCLAGSDPIAYASQGINYQYSQKLCKYSIVSGKGDETSSESYAYSFGCSKIYDYWMETLEWIKDSPDENMRITSWWDYGHWINYFGEKNTVLRNEHASLNMIGEVAHGYLTGTPEELKEFMISHDSEYALFDAELLFYGQSPGLGGKYGALNYLSCARNNRTTVEKGAMDSGCEAEQLWEVVHVPSDSQNAYYQECVLSPATGEKGVVVFRHEYTVNASGNLNGFINPYYCLGTTTLYDETQYYALYYLNEKYESGDLKLNKALLYSAGTTVFDPDYADITTFNTFHLLYTKDYVWVENGELKSGWEDRKGQFYDSNLYSAFFLNELEGFDLVFQSSGGEVKIYKIKE